MTDLIENMKVLLANVFAFRIKAQYYHWNIEGADFLQYHSYLGEVYQEADSSVDDIAEHIRALGAYAPGGFRRYAELTTIVEDITIQPAAVMFQRLADDNKKVHDTLTKCVNLADKERQRGVINFLEGLIDANEKTQWKLNSLNKISK